MSEDIFSWDEVSKFVAESVPEFQRELVSKAMQASTDEEFDSIGLMLSGENTVTGFIYRTGGSSRSGGEFWQHVKREVYDYVCTNSTKYKKERSDAAHHFGASVTIVATATASQFHLGIGVVTGLVTVALISVAKMGRNVWCAQQKMEPTKV